MYRFLDDFLKEIEEAKNTIRQCYALPDGGQFVIINVTNGLWDTIPTILLSVAYVRDKKRLVVQEWEVISTFDAVIYPFDDDNRISIARTFPED